MSLRHWIQLTSNTLIDKGLDPCTITNNDASFVDAGIESCWKLTSDQYISIPTSNMQYAEMKPGKQFSIAFWVKGATEGSWLIACGAWEIQFRTTLITVYAGPTSSYYPATYTTNTSPEQWRHIAFSWDGLNLKLYVDGKLRGGNSFRTTQFSLNDTLKLVYSGTRYMSDFRIYDHALSDKEVYEIAKGLMFHLKLDNTDLYDCSGFGWNVSKYSSGTLTENADTARYSKSLTFDSTGITLPLMIANGTKEFSIAYWMNPIGSGWRNIFSNRSGHASEGLEGMDMYISGSNQIRFYNRNSENMVTSETIPSNKFSHIVCTFREGSIKRIYINGKLSLAWDSTTGSISGIKEGFNISAIGMKHDEDDGTHSSSAIGDWMNGSISDFRIYRTALTDEQVAELYKVGGSIDNHGNAHCYELNEKPAYDDRLRFESVGNSTIGLNAKSSYQTIEYSKDYSTWTTMDTTTTISLSDKEVVYIRGILSADNTRYSNYTNFTMTGAIKGYGNINYLWNYQNLSAPLKKYCGHQLFISCSGLLLPPELPATELAEGCYEHMFQTCVNLLAFPELPAKTLVTNCYHDMFWRGGDANGQKANYLKCLATSGINVNNSTSSWFGTGAATTGTFVKDANATWPSGTSGIPSGWNVQNE